MYTCCECYEEMNEDWLGYRCETCGRPLCESCDGHISECSDCFCDRMEREYNE